MRSIPFLIQLISLFSFLLQNSKGFVHSIIPNTNVLSRTVYPSLTRNRLSYVKVWSSKPRITTLKASRSRKESYPITSMLLIANIVLFITTKGFPGLEWMFYIFKGNSRLFNKLLKSNVAIGRGQLYRLFTSMFLHGSPYHLLVNSMSIAQIGPILEKLFGPTRFLFIYLGAGILANYSTYLLDMSPTSVGASGCIFGMIGALGVFYFRNRVIIGRRSHFELENLKRTVLINLMYGMMSNNIDNGAHIGGLIGGVLLCFLFGPRLFVASRDAQADGGWWTDPYYH